jgi:CheY-like chemotaxis protein
MTNGTPSCNNRILVVDDEASVCDVIKRYLEREGYQVSVAGDGKSALDRCSGSRS